MKPTIMNQTTEYDVRRVPETHGMVLVETPTQIGWEIEAEDVAKFMEIPKIAWVKDMRESRNDFHPKLSLKAAVEAWNAIDSAMKLGSLRATKQNWKAEFLEELPW